MISASLSLSLPRLGWKSTSTPRSLKIATAAGDNASEMRTLGVMVAKPEMLKRGWMSSPSREGAQFTPPTHAANSRRLGERVLVFGIGPVEPQRQRFDVGAF